MPAVRAFALYAAVSLTFNFILQITCFVAAMALDARKVLDNRYDVFCCLQDKPSCKQQTADDSMSNNHHVKGGCFQTFIEDYYAPWLFKPSVRYV